MDSRSPDVDVIDRALAEDRLLITFDKDFGELVFRRGGRASGGVVLLRISQPLASRDDWAGHFSVVDDFTIRMRRLLPE